MRYVIFLIKRPKLRIEKVLITCVTFYSISFSLTYDVIENFSFRPDWSTLILIWCFSENVILFLFPFPSYYVIVPAVGWNIYYNMMLSWQFPYFTMLRFPLVYSRFLIQLVSKTSLFGENSAPCYPVLIFPGLPRT